MSAANEVISVNGTFLKVPDVTNTELKLCVSFKSSTDTDGTVVLAHHMNDCNKLSAYYLNTTSCITPPPPGDYSVGVFARSHDNILKAPTAPPTISIDTVPISEYVLIYVITLMAYKEINICVCAMWSLVMSLLFFNALYFSSVSSQFSCRDVLWYYVCVQVE